MSGRALGVALLGLALLAPHAGAEQRIAEIRQATNLALSVAPDGATLVIDLLGQLWKLPVSGGGAEPLTPPGERARNPRHSPDGRTVVYQRWIDGQWDLWLLDLESGERRALTTTPSNEREPDFRPDGTSIVYVADASGQDSLWSLDLATSLRTQITAEPGNASSPAVSLDGEIAYVLEHNGRWSLRALNGTVSRELFSSATPLSVPSWRPGGGVLVFGMQESPGVSRLQMLILSNPPVRKAISGREDIFRSRVVWPSRAELIYAADGQIWRRGLAELERHPIHLFAAVAVEAYEPPTDLGPLDAAGEHRARGIGPISRSADGERAVFSALGDLWLLERGRPRRLTDDPFVDIDPAISPDGDTIVFASDRSGEVQLWRMSLADGRQTLAQLTFGTRRSYRPSFSADGKRIAFLETAGHGPWSPAAVRLLSLAVPEAVETLAENVVPESRPRFGANGRSVELMVAEPDGGSRALLRLDLASEGIHRTKLPLTPSTDATPDAGEAPPPSAAIELAWQPPNPPPPFVLEVGRLFDGVRGTYHRHVDIHVVDGRIAAIVGRGLLPAPGQVIDARDATVIPGLVDVHAHQSSLVGERLGRAWLAFGVTTVREVAVDLSDALERGEAWASGRALGPRLLITPAAADDETRAAPVPIHSYPGVVHGFGHDMLRRAREGGLPVGKLPAPAALPEMRHVQPLYEVETSASYASYQDALSRLITSSAVLAPGLASVHGLRKGHGIDARIADDPAFRKLFGQAERDGWAQGGLLPDAVPSLQQTVARLVRGGGRVALGSDAPAVPYGLGLHLELALLAGAGLPNDHVLRLATAEAALALGVERDIGTIEVGKLADFVVIDGDPLTRIGDSLRIQAVVKGGHWLDRTRLLQGP